MTDTTIASPGGAPTASPSPAPGGGSGSAVPHSAPASPHPAQQNPVRAPAPIPPEHYDLPTQNPRARGYSPAMDDRRRIAAQQQIPAPGEQPALDFGQQPADQSQPVVQESVIRFGDGTEISESDVRAALAHKSEQDLRKQSLPQSPGDYQNSVAR
jgi:hypothetical protein